MSSEGRGPHSTPEIRTIVEATAARHPGAATQACIRYVRMAAVAAKIKLAEAEHR